ncbi:hypothetical protein GCM10007891_24470 [Methylophaga thalassica]|uniref:Conjugal transfer protein n=1 Tax=Methylophaga thalassica TaxID=40223 RepID=A0ABQ5TYW7_9GAMM|nr:type IV secretion system protein VirB3 [Methylophaga thalassica]GLQ00594.1 hypothetical protein GCM10007891_24470 [Methylophaga thalassica]
MAEDNEIITVDPLFVGLTRPTTLYGVPYFAAIFEFMVTVIFFLIHGNPLSLLIIIPVHGVLYLISAADSNIFSAIALWANTSSRCQNRMHWSGVSFSPLRLKGKIK